jgi:dTMP kinase
MSHRGLFLSLDGIDGTGKSTQCRLLVEWLNARGMPAILCHDPGGTHLGDRLRAILLDKSEDLSLRAEALLFMASRAELVERVIRPALEAGTTVISDRFVLANIAYQGHAGGLDPAELWEVGQFSTGGLIPSLTFILDLPVDEAVRRRGRDPDRIESREVEYRERLRQGFLSEAHRRPDRFRIIDAAASVEEIQERLRKQIEPLVHG